MSLAFGPVRSELQLLSKQISMLFKNLGTIYKSLVFPQPVSFLPLTWDLGYGQTLTSTSKEAHFASTLTGRTENTASQGPELSMIPAAFA